MRVFVIALVAAGCAGGDYSGPHPGVDSSGGAGDAQNPCIDLVVTPSPPVAGDHVKVTAVVSAAGVFTYEWRVDGVVNTMYEAANQSAIGFDAPDPVPHTVSVDISPSPSCGGHADRTIQIGNPNGALMTYRLRVISPANLAPPQEDTILIHGGTSSDRPIFVDPGFTLAGSVRSGATAVPAYLKFTPVDGPAFDLVTTGSFSAQLALKAHTVLVVPTNNALAPRLFAWTAATGPTMFPVDAGTAVHGIVRDRANNPLANAQVQLAQLGVPSTIATTDGTGQFTAQVAFDATDPVTVIVTPPATSGLARLTATGNFDLAQQVQVSYATSPAPCDLAGSPVKRGGVNQGGAVVTAVGSLAGVGSVTAGVTATATGTVHVVATANGGGTLPALLVPRTALQAVIQLGPTDFAVADLDTTACPAQVLDAPPMITASGTVLDAQGAPQPIAGVKIEAFPIGSLALANLLPVQTTSVDQGAFTLHLAAGAHYAVRFQDPSAHNAEFAYPDLTAAGIPAMVQLAPAVALTGTVQILNYPNSIENASVTLLCATCTGVAASTPIAQTATDFTGSYRLAIPDPGDL